MNPFKPSAIILSLVLCLSIFAVTNEVQKLDPRTFSTMCSTPGCKLAITNALPLAIVTNSIKEMTTAPGSGYSNVLIHVTLVCPALHTNSYRREFVTSEPVAFEDPPLPPPLPKATPLPALWVTNTSQTVTVHIVLHQQ